MRVPRRHRLPHRAPRADGRADQGPAEDGRAHRCPAAPRPPGRGQDGFRLGRGRRPARQRPRPDDARLPRRLDRRRDSAGRHPEGDDDERRRAPRYSERTRDRKRVVVSRGKGRTQMTLYYRAVWTAAGMPPADILKAMTTNAAELLDIQKERGALATGQAADIIATPANP